MTEVRIGRLLAACLHQAIADCLPQRVDFYETWLHSEGLRDGSIGLAPITGVIGFLRTEGEAYEQVMARAGTLAADWTIRTLTPFRRRAVAWLPRGLRARAALRLAASIVRSIHRPSRASTRVRKNRASLEVGSSLFCAVRESQATPLCGFYLAVAIETLRQFGVPALGRIEKCHAVDGRSCVLVLELADASAVPDPALAA